MPKFPKITIKYYPGSMKKDNGAWFEKFNFRGIGWRATSLWFGDLNVHILWLD